LSESRSRVLPILSKSNNINNKSKEHKETMSNEQKQEFASLFSNILKNIIQKETINPNLQKEEEKEMKKIKKLLPKQEFAYLEPLDRVTDIILNDLIAETSQELDIFCCQIVDILIESETNI